MANRKRKLNTIVGANKRMHLDRRALDGDSDSTHDQSSNENDDGDNSRLSHLEDGNCKKKSFCFFPIVIG